MERINLMNRSRWAGVLGGILMALLLVPVARAAEEKLSQPRAVLVGISKYADKQIKARKHAENDAKILYDLFINKDYLGVEPKNIRLLLGKEDEQRHSKPATRQNILDALEWLAKESRPDDLTLFVFIGEGGSLGARGERRCYFATDSTVKDRAANAVAAADIGKRLEKLTSRKFCAFIDITFKGFEAATVPEATLGHAPYSEFLGDDSEDHNFLPGRTAFLATNGLSVSLDLKEHGLFTTAVLDGLKGAADKEGYEPDGLVTVGELNDYLAKAMPELAKKYGQNDDEKDQIHYVLGDRNSLTPVTTNPAVLAKVRQRLEKFDKLIADGKLPDKLAAEGHHLLRQMPRLKSQQSLRKAYQQVIDGKLTVAAFEEKRKEIADSNKLDREVAEKFAREVLGGAELLSEGFVREVKRGELVSNALRGLYRRVGERMSSELAERLSKAKKLKKEELRELLIDARLHLGKREDLEGHKDVDIALARMVGQLGDKHSIFVDPETLDQFRKGTEGAFVGIGVQIKKDRATDQLLVVTPLKGSPAYRAGIKAGDLITTITLTVDKQGKPLKTPEVLQTKGLGINEAVAKIVGKPGTKVTITVQRPGEDRPHEFVVARKKIEVETVMGFQRKSDDDWDFMVDPKSKLGYIRLTQFTRNSAEDIIKAVSELKKQGVRGLVLDMRNNPGGLLTSAEIISDLFIDDGLIVTIRPRQGKEDPRTGESPGSETDFPMAVLINGGSASGSEIVAACLQDHGRAIIMGERSYGKGTVQNVVPFAGGEVKLTTATFWRPSGRNLNKDSTKGRDEDEWGVSPSKKYELKLSPKETEELEEHQHETEIIRPKDNPRKRSNPEFRDRQLEMALDYLRGQVKLADRAKLLRGE
jgi:C-terminal peptidase prc